MYPGATVLPEMSTGAIDMAPTATSSACQKPRSTSSWSSPGIAVTEVAVAPR